MSAPVKRTAKNTIQHVAKAIRSPAPTTFLSIKYDPRPGPVNDTAFPLTRLMLLDRSHPLHIKTKRRYAAFDPRLLHWTVRTPANLSKKAVVRNWATKRIREAVRNELKARGFASDGSLLAGQEERQPLKGAMTVFISNNHGLLLASGAEVKDEVARIVKQLVSKCQRPESQPSHTLRKHKAPGKIEINEGTGEHRVRLVRPNVDYQQLRTPNRNLSRSSPGFGRWSAND